MILKRLEIQGFKSFAKKTTIEFEKGITAVVGPNGSGKSNISDSVRWVLGEQSARTLRGDKMEDIIFNGTDDKAPLGFAEVSMVLNNEDRVFPIDYSEVVVTRRVFRTGDSEYLINKKASRLKDVRELFMDTGIGKDGYSIISQGKIDEILSSKSEERRGIFEEAAGIIKYKSRKTESERKLKRTKDNLVRIEDIVQEVKGQIEPLEKQAKKAELFFKYEDILKNSEVELICNEIKILKSDIDEIENKLEKLISEKNTSIEKEAFVIEELKKMYKLLEKIDSEIEGTNKEKYELINKKDRLKSDIYLHNEKYENNRKYRKRTELDIAETEIDIENFKRDIKENEELVSTLKSVIVELDELLEKNEVNIAEKEKALENKDKVLSGKKDLLIENLNKTSEYKLSIGNIESHQKMFDNRRISIQNSLDEIESSETKIARELKDAENRISKNKKTTKEAKISFESMLRELENLVETNTENQSKINRLRNISESKVSSVKIIKEMQKDYEGYYKGVKDFLNRVKKSKLQEGIEGVVAELIETDKEYEKAIEVALGSSIQNIVTKNTDYAKRSIAFLKEKKLGRITFLPLDNIRGRTLYDSERAILLEKGVIGNASSLVKYDSKFTNIVENILGRIIVVDNIDNMIIVSKKYSNKFRIVTLEGDVMNPGGSITGGSFRSNSLSLLGRGRQIEELEMEIVKLNSEYNSLLVEKERLEKKIYTKKSEIENSRAEVNALIIEGNTIDNEISKLKETKGSSDSRKSKYHEELKQIFNEIEKLSLQKIELQRAIDERLSENAIVESEIKSDSEEFKISQLSLSEYKEKHVSIQVNYASKKEKCNSIDMNLTHQKNDIKKAIVKKDEYSRRISEIDREIFKVNSEIEKTEKDIREQITLIEKNAEVLDNLNKEKANHIIKINLKEEEKNSIIEKKEIYTSSINELNINKERVVFRLNAIKTKLWEDYEMSLIMAEQKEKSGREQSELRKIVNDSKRKLRDLGNINLNSIEELKTITERYSFLSGQRNDLIEAEASLKYVIKEMNNKMKSQFIQKFNEIRVEFKEVFKELFGGGRADIIIEDEDDILNSGIEVVAEPPGKKLQSLSLLSGGERALTAISLLFSILKIKPTPFCILDEIEAALDEANVYRYADYLKKFSEESQFVVITHRKGTMEAADSIYGVTMQKNGISELISLKLEECK